MTFRLAFRIEFRRKRYVRLAATAAVLAGLIAPRAGSAAEGVALKSYNADITQTSISGISSGAFMSVQFGVAWSSIIKGIGVVAGGPYYCAQASAADVMNGYTLPIATATGPCMQGPPPELGPMFEEAQSQARSGVIDPLSNIKQQRIYLFHGYNDSVVAKPVTDAAADFFRHYLDDATRGNIYYQEARSAGHAFVVNEAPQADLNACPLNRSPYIDECGYDQAGVILQHIYGALQPGTSGPPAGTVYSFDQNLYTGDHIADALSMGDEGFVFVPKDCEAARRAASTSLCTAASRTPATSITCSSSTPATMPGPAPIVSSCSIRRPRHRASCHSIRAPAGTGGAMSGMTTAMSPSADCRSARSRRCSMF